MVNDTLTILLKLLHIHGYNRFPRNWEEFIGQINIIIDYKLMSEEERRKNYNAYMKKLENEDE